MKKIILMFGIIGAIALTKSVHAYTHQILYFETPSGKVLEMPAYHEAAIIETIPGQEIENPETREAQNKADQFLDHAHLSRVLLCITKPEETEPFPFDLN